MTGSERRQELLQLLSGTQTPISGTSLAKHFTVSRQVIVQDMALLRAQGHEVLSTNRGYLIQAPLRVYRIFKVFHTSGFIQLKNILIDFIHGLNVFFKLINEQP